MNHLLIKLAPLSWSSSTQSPACKHYTLPLVFSCTHLFYITRIKNIPLLNVVVCLKCSDTDHISTDLTSLSQHATYTIMWIWFQSCGEQWLQELSCVVLQVTPLLAFFFFGWLNSFYQFCSLSTSWIRSHTDGNKPLCADEQPAVWSEVDPSANSCSS